jgi:hypothetical protein
MKARLQSALRPKIYSKAESYRGINLLTLLPLSRTKPTFLESHLSPWTQPFPEVQVQALEPPVVVAEKAAEKVLVVVLVVSMEAMPVEVAVTAEAELLAEEAV